MYKGLASIADYEVRVNHKVIQDLRSLNKDECLVVSEPYLMRGVDYRAKNKETGIDLLIAHSFSNTRAYI